MLRISRLRRAGSLKIQLPSRHGIGANFLDFLPLCQNRTALVNRKAGVVTAVPGEEGSSGNLFPALLASGIFTEDQAVTPYAQNQAVFHMARPSLPVRITGSHSVLTS